MCRSWLIYYNNSQLILTSHNTILKYEVFYFKYLNHLNNKDRFNRSRTACASLFNFFSSSESPWPSKLFLLIFTLVHLIITFTIFSSKRLCFRYDSYMTFQPLQLYKYVMLWILNSPIRFWTQHFNVFFPQ